MSAAIASVNDWCHYDDLGDQASLLENELKTMHQSIVSCRIGAGQSSCTWALEVKAYDHCVWTSIAPHTAVTDAICGDAVDYSSSMYDRLHVWVL